MFQTEAIPWKASITSFLFLKKTEVLKKIQQVHSLIYST